MGVGRLGFPRGFPPLPSNEPSACLVCGGTGQLPAVLFGETSITISARRVHLSPQQVNIVRLLVRHMGKSVHKERLYTVMWPMQDEPDDYVGILRVQITKIRHKLAGLASVELAWDFGYRLVLDTT